MRYFTTFLMIFLGILTLYSCDSCKKPQPQQSKTPAQIEQPKYDPIDPNKGTWVAPGVYHPNQAPDLEQIKKDFEERKTFQKVWFDSAELVAFNTQYPQARAIINFLRSNVYVVRPIRGNAARVIEETTGKIYPIAMLTIMEKDLQNDEDLKKFVLNSGAGAGYNCVPSVLTVHPYAVSDIWRGLIFLHEGGHAKANNETPYDCDDERINAIEETKIHDFQNHLMLILGGEKYTKLLEDEIQRIKKIEDSAPTVEGKIILVSRTDYNIEFDTIFGPAKSDRERDLRQTHFNCHAQFVLIERRYQSEDLESIQEHKAMWYHQTRLLAQGEN